MHQESQRYKKLFRSRKDKLLAGVCGGLAAYFAIDPTWVRLFFIFFFLVFGTALLLYVILWVIVPLESENNQGDKNSIKIVNE